MAVRPQNNLFFIPTGKFHMRVLTPPSKIGISEEKARAIAKEWKIEATPRAISKARNAKGIIFQLHTHRKRFTPNTPLEAVKRQLAAMNDPNFGSANFR